MSTSAPKRYTVEEYLQLEESSDVKHEYHDGELFAMTGATFRHNQISASLVRLLGNALQDSDCQVLGSDMRVVCPSGLRTYPDLSVVCDRPEFSTETEVELLNPLLLVEVLSESTEGYDRGKKFEFYRSIESLNDYVLVAQDRASVHHFHRAESGMWSLRISDGLDQNLAVPALDIQVSRAGIYQGIDFTDAADD